MLMSNVVVLRGERSAEAGARPAHAAHAAGPALGPAEVTQVSPSEVEVRLKTGALVRAELALGYPYEACRGDVVLVIGDAGGHYVIGVLRGTGRSVLELPGDVDLRAVNGVLRLSGDKGVEVAGPDLSIQVSRLQVIAETAVQRFASLCQRVTDLLSVQAGQRHTVIEGSSHEQSKSATLLTEEKMTINGKAIYLG
jgi:uncharacterized protein (DUF2345 family)